VTIHSHFVLAFAPFAAAVLFSPPARADDFDQLWAEGKSLKESGKCGDAIVVFRNALKLRPDKLGSLGEIAKCETELGMFASARADWSRLRIALLHNDDPTYKGWSDFAEKAYNVLDARVARIRVRVSGAPNRVEVSIDGTPLHPDLVGTELERDCGPHTIEVSYGGAAPLRAERTLTEGAHDVVTFTVPDDPTFGGNRRRTVGILTLAVGGGISTVVTAVAIGVRQNALATIHSACGTHVPCYSTRAVDAQHVGVLANGVMDTFAILGGASLAVGIPLVVTGSSWSPAKSGALTPAPGGVTGVQVSLAPAVGGGGLRIAGMF
jgi:hypothetical protein